MTKEENGIIQEIVASITNNVAYFEKKGDTTYNNDFEFRQDVNHGQFSFNIKNGQVRTGCLNIKIPYKWHINIENQKLFILEGSFRIIKKNDCNKVEIGFKNITPPS